MSSRRLSAPDDPALAPMTLDLITGVLARADSPAALAAYLADELRELTGARCVLFTDEESAGGSEPRVFAISPARRRGWEAGATGRRVLELARGLEASAVLRAGDGSELGRLLGAEGFDTSVAVRLLVGQHRVGTLLLLGDPDESHVAQVLSLLDVLATVVALVARNAFLFERQEQIIAERTRELREANEALRTSRDRIRLALAGTHFVWDWDLERGELTIEPEWASWHGSPGPVLRGTVPEILARVVHPDDLELVLARNLAHQRGETSIYESEHRTVRADGSIRWVQVRGRVVARAADGRALRLSGVTADVTDRRTLQAQLERTERLASLGTLAAGVAHEINNPLTFIGSSVAFVAERLRERGLADPELEGALRDAQDGTARVREVVRGLKAFSRPVASLDEPIDLESELRAALRISENELRHAARLEVEIGPLPRVSAKAHQLGQVFVNLLVNAAQAIPPGDAATARVGLRAWTDPAGRACVEISDTGVGIPAPLLRRIFEPFFTTKPQGVGTGLGLSISHSIVTAAGGTIDVESTVGQGTLVRVTLPPVGAAGVAQAAPGVAPDQPAPAGGARAGGRVLVVDDEPAVARAVQRALAAQFDVTVAHSATQALALLEGGAAVDAVLCDLMMPGVDGMEFHRRVSAAWPALGARCVFLTGGAFTPSALAFLAVPGRRWVEKPFEAAALRQALAEVIGARTAAPAAATPGA